MNERFISENEKMLDPQPLEISGWDRDGMYFEEIWRSDINLEESNKARTKLMLRRALAPESMLFIRHFSMDSSSEAVPNPYSVVEGKQTAQDEGLWEYRIAPMHPQKKAPIGNELASNSVERTATIPEPRESSEWLRHREELHEA